ncbi:hypothetical protein [Tumebacillus avium]|nr:hypothetical protein [Tumebacillus avium]
MKKFSFFVLVTSSLIIASFSATNEAYVKPIDPDGIIVNQTA